MDAKFRTKSAGVIYSAALSTTGITVAVAVMGASISTATPASVAAAPAAAAAAKCSSPPPIAKAKVSDNWGDTMWLEMRGVNKNPLGMTYQYKGKAPETRLWASATFPNPRKLAGPIKVFSICRNGKAGPPAIVLGMSRSRNEAWTDIYVPAGYGGRFALATRQVMLERAASCLKDTATRKAWDQINKQAVKAAANPYGAVLAGASIAYKDLYGRVWVDGCKGMKNFAKIVLRAVNATSKGQDARVYLSASYSDGWTHDCHVFAGGSPRLGQVPFAEYIGKRTGCLNKAQEA